MPTPLIQHPPSTEHQSCFYVLNDIYDSTSTISGYSLFLRMAESWLYITGRESVLESETNSLWCVNSQPLALLLVSGNTRASAWNIQYLSFHVPHLYCCQWCYHPSHLQPRSPCTPNSNVLQVKLPEYLSKLQFYVSNLESKTIKARKWLAN